MIKLTDRQSQVLECIQQYIEQTGFPPTRANIAHELGFRSANAAEDHLKALSRKGVIEIIHGTSRGIRVLLETEVPSSGLPVVGRVAAGAPILAEQNLERHINMDSSCFHPAADFLLTVHGDSMIGAGIFDGDLVAVHNQQTASNGEIVVARIDEDVTVKRFKKERNKILLISENPAYDPIQVNKDSGAFAIEGLVVGVIRTQI